MTNKNFLNHSLLRLKKGSGEKNIVFIHDGCGEAIQYLTFCNQIDPEFNVYGLRFPANKDNLTPAVQDVEQLAHVYLDYLQAAGVDQIYLILGYCIGGKIAYAMANQLDYDPYLVLLNVVPPNQKRKSHNFTLKEELGFLRQRILLPPRSLRQAKTTAELWQNFVSLLQTYPWAFFIVKSLMPPYMKNIIRQFRIYDQPQEVIFYLNLVRGFEETHYRYQVKENPLPSRAFYFNATKEPIKTQLYWKKLFKQITFHHVNSNHVHLIQPQNAAFIVETVRKGIAHDHN